MIKKLITTISILSISTLIIAADNFVIPQYKSTKSMSMGNTKYLAGIDETALIYNPALLKEIDKSKFTLPHINAHLESSAYGLAKDFYSLYNDIDSDLDDENMIKVLTAYLDGVSKTVTNNNSEIVLNEDSINLSGEYLNLEENLFMGFASNTFGAGAFQTTKVNNIGVVDNPEAPTVFMDTEVALQVPIGIAFKFNRFNIGASIRYIEALKIDTELGVTDLTDLTGDDLSDGEEFAILGAEEASGVGVNLGLVYSGDKFNYALSIQDPFTELDISKYVEDVENNEFSLEKVGTKEVPTNVSIAISSKRLYTKTDKLTQLDRIFWSAELENIFSQDLDGDGFDDDSLFKKLHLGAEYKAFNIFSNLENGLFLRTGLNQGYLTYGLALKLPLIDIEYASYTEEAGPRLGMDAVERQALSFEISF